jgi:hypothetical protein
VPDNELEFQAAFARLVALPVWVIVRLCTREPAVLEYWNDLDAKLEEPVDVICDMGLEAAEVVT